MQDKNILSMLDDFIKRIQESSLIKEKDAQKLVEGLKGAMHNEKPPKIAMIG